MALSYIKHNMTWHSLGYLRYDSDVAYLRYLVFTWHNLVALISCFEMRVFHWNPMIRNNARVELLSRSPPILCRFAKLSLFHMLTVN